MSKAKRVLKSILCFALVFVMGGGSILSAFSLTANAEETSFNIDTSSPLDDLKGATIEGEPFDADNFSPKKKDKSELLLLAEVGYGAKDFSEYGLYAYVYTPGLKLANGISETDRQFINLIFNGEPKTFYMDILNCSIDEASSGYFYKMKLDFEVDGTDFKKEFYDSLDPNVRCYEVSLLGVCEYGRYSLQWLDTINTSKKYYYSGYTQGNGNNETEESTLSLLTDKLDALELDVKSTYYRLPYIKNAQGTEQECVIDAQDTLHSVYFSVPNRYIEAYGAMSKVHATWRDAVLKPALVLGDKDIYDAVFPYLGKRLSSSSSRPEFRFYSDFYSWISTGLMTKTYRYFGYTWNGVLRYPPEESDIEGYDRWAKNIDLLDFLFLTEATDLNAADSYTLSAERIEQHLEERSKALLEADPSLDSFRAGSSVFAYNLFESISSELVDVNISANENFVLESQLITQNFIQEMFGWESVTAFDDLKIKAIYAVTDADFELPAIKQAADDGRVKKEEYSKAVSEYNGDSSRYEELFGPLIADALCITRSDYAEFKAYYNSAKSKGETVYLFRYDVSDYLCEEVNIYDKFDATEVSTNGYFFQMKAHLGFDIIDVTFEKNGVETVVDVVMDPINIFDDATPPVDVTEDEDPADWWSDIYDLFKLILIILIVIVAFIGLSFAMPFISPVLSIFGDLIKTLFSLLLLPFRAIGNLFKRRR